jgi:hypothetical protein
MHFSKRGQTSDWSGDLLFESESVLATLKRDVSNHHNNVQTPLVIDGLGLGSRAENERNYTSLFKEGTASDHSEAMQLEAGDFLDNDDGVMVSSKSLEGVLDFIMGFQSRVSLIRALFLLHHANISTILPEGEACSVVSNASLREGQDLWHLHANGTLKRGVRAEVFKCQSTGSRLRIVDRN